MSKSRGIQPGEQTRQRRSPEFNRVGVYSPQIRGPKEASGKAFFRRGTLRAGADIVACLDDLVAKAVGIDLNRGDQVEVVAMPFFAAEPVVRAVPPAFYTNPWFIGSSVFGVLLVALGLGLWMRSRRRQRELEAALIASKEAEARRLEAERRDGAPERRHPGDASST